MKRNLGIAACVLVLSFTIGLVLQHGSRAPEPGAAKTSEARVRNDSPTGTVVYATFGSDSAVKPGDWKFCEAVPSGCRFPLGPKETRDLPTGGRYLNVNLSFDEAGSCAVTGTTLGEMTLNVVSDGGNFDTTDISMVNGWNADIQIEVSGGQPTLGPTNGLDSGVTTYGVFPNGCDLCVARHTVPCPWQTSCGTGNDGGPPCGCHAGTQYAPTPVCQVTGVPRGSVVTVVLLKH